MKTERQVTGQPHKHALSKSKEKQVATDLALRNQGQESASRGRGRPRKILTEQVSPKLPSPSQDQKSLDEQLYFEVPN